MRSERAKEVVSQAVDRRAEAGRGLGRSIMRFGSGRQLDLNIADMERLPVVPNTVNIQNPSTAAFYLLTGYSAVGGPDVVM